MSALAKQDVLIVDDDDSIRKLLCRALERIGLRCGLAIDGLDGAHQIHEVEYALILLDLMMPRVDGFGFLEYLREWQQSSGFRTVVIFMTAAPERMELTETADMVQAVIAKPFDVHSIATLCRDTVDARREYEAATPARIA